MSPTRADSISLDLNGAHAHLIVVSNRLPVTINKDAQGEYHFKMSSGGLVSALSGCKKSMSFTWIGWPGFFIPPKDRPLVNKRLLEEYSCQAVYLDDDVADKHYNGFSNSILWPLFHYHPGEMNFDEENWLAYRQANFAFAEAIMSQVGPGSMVWVQDYHLMLLPMFLRTLIDGPGAVSDATAAEVAKILDGVQQDEIVPANIEGVKIGYFLHTPFPSSEIYRRVFLHFLFSRIFGPRAFRHWRSELLPLLFGGSAESLVPFVLLCGGYSFSFPLESRVSAVR